jgi:hypothetical protein
VETRVMKMKKEVMCLLPCYVSDICYVIQVSFGGVQMFFIHVWYELHTYGKCFFIKVKGCFRSGTFVPSKI